MELMGLKESMKWANFVGERQCYHLAFPPQGGCCPPWRAQHCTGSTREVCLLEGGWVGCRSSQIFASAQPGSSCRMRNKGCGWPHLERTAAPTQTASSSSSASSVPCASAGMRFPGCPRRLQLCHCNSAAVVHAIGIHLSYSRNWNPSKRVHWPFN